MISVLCYILIAKWTTYVTLTIQYLLCLLQFVAQILIYCFKQTIVKTLDMNKLVPKLGCIPKIHNVDITV